jgi:small neutral amino acid transporter SnatA (MarC family)
MVPLAAGITIDCALIVGLVFDGVRVVILSTTIFAVFFILWFLLPRVSALQRALGGRDASSR